jgi:hypothetical protein
MAVWLKSQGSYYKKIVLKMEAASLFVLPELAYRTT